MHDGALPLKLHNHDVRVYVDAPFVFSPGCVKAHSQAIYNARQRAAEKAAQLLHNPSSRATDGDTIEHERYDSTFLNWPAIEWNDNLMGDAKHFNKYFQLEGTEFIVWTADWNEV
eukprot:TRINITY_DN63121_c0_g1_i2.p2 TRINITY_DN63121_c0_g1~~TRINITY_DN63121_c0_g1_i2.p2  ORF type:complete len:115 (+),score=17.91 TRINITY_DN63121_c0_g1_i2:652-996(+)